MLILVRHTSVSIDAGVCYGKTDVPLAEGFEAEADAVIAQLPKARRLVTSPLTRCRRLAQAISQSTGLTPEPDPDLAEIDLGAWEGQTWDSIGKDSIDAWNRDLRHATPHGGESVGRFESRVAAALQKYRNGPTPCLIITHGGVIRAAQRMETSSDAWPAAIAFGAFITLP